MKETNTQTVKYVDVNHALDKLEELEQDLASLASLVSVLINGMSTADGKECARAMGLIYDAIMADSDEVGYIRQSLILEADNNVVSLKKL